MKGRVKVVFFSLGAGVTLSCGCRTSVLPKLGSDVISSHPVLECCAFGIAKPDKISHSPLVASHKNTNFEDLVGWGVDTETAEHMGTFHFEVIISFLLL